MSTGEKFERAAGIMARLRAPGGCPWDREQSFDTIKPYTLEETYEVFEAIENRDWRELQGELGDLLLQVLFYAQMADEAGYFTIGDVLDALSDKLVRRHPHVFADTQASDSAAVLRNWDLIKQQERGEESAERKSLLASVSRKMPALQEAEKISRKAAATGFDWPDAHRILDKLREETGELATELRAQTFDRERLQDEVGDLFFTVVNIARSLKIDPESALRHSNAKFRLRFAAIERAAWASDRDIKELTPDEMNRHWDRAKEETARG